MAQIAMLIGIFARMINSYSIQYPRMFKPTDFTSVEISNNVVCATSKDPDQPVHTRSLIRAFASRLNIL